MNEEAGGRAIPAGGPAQGPAGTQPAWDATGPSVGLAELERSGPLDPSLAAAMLSRAADLMDGGDFSQAGRFYQRIIGATSDHAQTAAALFGLGTALYRLDHEDQALAAWEQVLALPETAFTYRAWREIAAARVRDHDLPAAQRAYREAERRAPAQDRAEIASRLGWLAKETGDARGARRYFARSRGGYAAPVLTLALIGVTALVSVVAFEPRSDLFNVLALDKAAVARGEYWRLLTVTLLHGGYLHLFFNMYALYLAGSLVEQLYGTAVFGAIYLLAAAAGSVGSFLFGGDAPSVGASGAIFGLFGVLLAVSRTHHPVLDRRGQMLLGQIGGLIILNLLFGFGFNVVGGNIDNFAHLGGLIAGLWLGFLLVPGRVPTLSALWQRPGGQDLVSTPGIGGLRILGVVALVVAIALGVAVGTQARRNQASHAAHDGARTVPAVIAGP